MTKKKPPAIRIDPAVYAAMQEYSSGYGLSLSELIQRMWMLWSDIEKAREAGIFPTHLQDKLDEPLDSFLAEMQRQADTLDEEYKSTPKQQREAAIASYQETYPFIPDSDDTPVECPSCHRQTTKAGLVYLPNDEIRCTGCYTLPHALQQYREAFPESE